MIIASILENQKIEKRIAITPETAKKYVSLGLEVSLSENYGNHLGIKDEEYKKLGVSILKDEKDIIVNTDIIAQLGLLDDDKSEINPYYHDFKSHEFDIKIENNKFRLSLSNYGLVLIKNSSLDQAIEIVRRRVDEIGTNEPNILKRGNDRILVELPGLDDPNRIK